MVTAQLIREARRGSGLSQRALAESAGFTQPALADIERSAHDARVGSVDRLVGAVGSKLFVLPTRRSAAATWADTIFEELRGNRRSEDVAFRALIGLSDDLAGADLSVRVALCVAVPAPCGDRRFDAAVAAIVDHHLSVDGLPVPAWVGESSRALEVPWAVSPHAEPSEVPEAFLRHGVLLAASELESV